MKICSAAGILLGLYTNLLPYYYDSSAHRRGNEARVTYRYIVVTTATQNVDTDLLQTRQHARLISH